MLRDAHKAQEISAEVVRAIKDERWSDAKHHLAELQDITSRLVHEVAKRAPPVSSARAGD